MLFTPRGFLRLYSIDQIAIDLSKFSAKPSSHQKEQHWNLKYYLPCDQCLAWIPDLKDLEDNQQSGFVKSFNELTETICDAEDPLETTKQFFNILLAQVNSQNNTSITIDEACRLVRQNMDLISTEYREFFLKAVDAIEQNQSGPVGNNPFLNVSNSIYWPWEWNWFGLNKKHKHPNHQSTAKNTGTVPGKKFLLALAIAAITVVCVLNAEAIPAAGKVIVEIIEIIISS